MGMGGMREIKRRIKSVESTRQITKAMELVASSKLRRAKEKADGARPFFNALYETMCQIASESAEFRSLFTSAKATAVKKALLIVVAGDRGLAGGFNANVLKLSEERTAELRNSGYEVAVMPIGRKAVEYFEKRGREVVNPHSGIAETITIYRAAAIADEIVNLFLSGHYSRSELFYTSYISPLAQEAKRVAVLPVEIPKSEKRAGSSIVYDPSPEAVFDYIVPRYISGLIYGAVVDSFASEQAARRTAMESATDNADEMISNLSLMYNRARQAAITQEITEIVGGASAGESAE